MTTSTFARISLRVLAVALLAAQSAACSLMQGEPLDPPVVNLRALEPEAMGINAQTFRARLSLFNPNAVPLRVSSGAMEFDIAGVRAAKGRTLAPFAVDAGATTEIEIRVTTNVLRDGPALFRALQSGGGAEGLAYALKGYVNVERRGPDRVPISAAGTFAPGNVLRAPAADPGTGSL